MPVVTVLFASMLANEAVTIDLLVGGLLVLLGVYVGALFPADLLKRVVSQGYIGKYLNKPD
jgi:hypothetical protein